MTEAQFVDGLIRVGAVVLAICFVTGFIVHKWDGD